MATNEKAFYAGSSLVSLPTEILTRIVTYLLPQVDFPDYEVESLPDGTQYWRWNPWEVADTEGPQYWDQPFSDDIYHLAVTSRLMSEISLPLLYQAAATYGYERFARFLTTLVKKPEIQANIAHLMVDSAAVVDRPSCKVMKYLRPNYLDLPSLKSLDVTHASPFENAGFLREWLQLLPHLPSLERLVLRCFKESLDHLPFPQLPKLKELHLYDCFMSDRDRVIAMLNNVPKLQVLINHCSIYNIPEAAWDACGDTLKTFACTISWNDLYHLHKLTNLRHLKMECSNIYSHQNRGLSKEVGFLANTLETIEFMVNLEDELVYPRGPEEVSEDEDRFTDFKHIVLDLEKKCQNGFKKLRVIDVRSFHDAYYNGTKIFASVREFLDAVDDRLTNELGVTLLHHKFPESDEPHVLDKYFDRISDEDSEDDVDDEEASDSAVGGVVLRWAGSPPRAVIRRNI